MTAFLDNKLEYLQKHNIAQLTEHIVRNIMEDLPENPIKYVHDLLERPIPPQIVIAGPPGSGKGTQCQAIVERFGVVHISSGDLLRAEVAAGTEVGKMAETFIHNGEMVPNKIVINAVRKRLEQDDVKERGWLLDGFPRSRDQAEALESSGIVPHVFLLLEVPDTIVVERIENRRTDPATGMVYHLLYNPPPPEDVALCERLIQRDDDHRETVEARLRIYHEKLHGLKEHYGTLVETINGDQSIHAVTEGVLAVVERRRLK
ncbi:adenylate kinase 1 [Trypanosoma cruzi]|uniref:Adenylate kinase, putative n=2 Tax=Trypanosoma cruzi TaxID=5693 RepID=Q4E1S6_TRYCC|nr:adenylate kinase, putative [Trypanosoma cruzi]EAN98727.1 adenylate kinase, putative [Trypanosoma cruzi]PWV06242.1 adenylate kinase 1 [Trypanosoma cruzi]RNC45545.1 adenylate kinase [Trypanosoma cruzi]|eukprot:XP_820578.1 adenylate kinase [Trypanosoma cruzi strain CL Brener]